MCCSSTRMGAMRTVGMLCVMCSVIQISLAINWTITVVGWYRSIWVGIVMVLITPLIFYPASRRRYTVFMSLYIIGCVGAFISFLIDLLISGYISSLDTCANNELEIFGDPAYETFVEYCVEHKTSDSDCFCTSKNELDSCFLFELYKGSDCDKVLDSSGNLFWTAFFTFLIFAFTLTLAICTGQAACCPNTCGYQDESIHGVQIFPLGDYPQYATPTTAHIETPANHYQASQVPILVEAIPMTTTNVKQTA